MPTGDDKDFGKQRRNLMLISALIVLSDFLDINYSNANIFGIKAENIENISSIIWILWIYFFIRFLNLFFEEPSKGLESLLNIYDQSLTKQAFKKFKNDFECSESSSFDCNYDRKKLLNQQRTIVLINDRNNNKTYNFKYTLSIFIFVKCFLTSIIKTHYFFEYYFPIFFGLLPLITLNYKGLGVLVSWW